MKNRRVGRGNKRKGIAAQRVKPPTLMRSLGRKKRQVIKVKKIKSIKAQMVKLSTLIHSYGKKNRCEKEERVRGTVKKKPSYLDELLRKEV